MDSTRRHIILRSAEWHAVAAIRSSSPLKDRGAIKQCVALIKTEELGEIESMTGIRQQEAYDLWHAKTVEGIVAKAPELSFGWAAKLVNVYIKTLAYISDDFWPKLRGAIHPAIDGMLQDMLEKEGLQKTKVGLKDMDREAYRRLIAEYRNVAAAQNIALVEVDKYWEY